MRGKFYILLFLLTANSFCLAQKKITYNNQVWLGDFSKIKVNDKWSIYLDFGLRRKEWLDKWSQTLIRPGLTYAVNGNVSITAGVAYFNLYSANYIRPEYRGWEQLLFSETVGRFKVNHRLRAEQRFNQSVQEDELINDYNYNNRFRYQLNVQLALNHSSIENRTLYLNLSDEVMINSGKEIIYNYFDQNRLAAGVGYKWNDLLNISISYVNVFVQKNTLNTFENNTVIVLNLFHVIDVQKSAGKAHKG